MNIFIEFKGTAPPSRLHIRSYVTDKNDDELPAKKPFHPGVEKSPPGRHPEGELRKLTIPVDLKRQEKSVRF
jgi:hypothetical protein